MNGAGLLNGCRTHGKVKTPWGKGDRAGKQDRIGSIDRTLASL
jgi:hypothetical protein